MNREKGKILMLVEGEKTDVQLMMMLLKYYGIDSRHQIVSYKTNIYVLYNQMFRSGDPSDVDILQLLKEHESDSEKKQIFENRFSDILLVFDLDPQDPQFNADKVVEMIEYFVESSDMGKLYLNYPMIESFYHMKSIPDDDYNNYIVSMDELRKKTYKSRVQRECRNNDYSKFAANRVECSTVIRQNIEKAWLISKKKDFAVKADKLLPESTDVLSAQIKSICERNELSVLCTCAFYIADYNPSFILSDEK